MEGVRPADGGAVAAGFGVNSTATDGFVTSNQVAADGTEIGSVETFSQSDQAITHTVRTSSDFCQDTAANEAIVPIVDAFNPTAPGRIVTVQLGTGQVSQFPSVSTFFVSGVAIDPTTHRALIPSNTSFGIYDLSAQTGTAPTVGGSIYQHPAADSAHARFLVQEVSPPGSTGATPNNNAMSAVDVLNEQGDLVQRIAQFNFFNIFLLDMGSYLQVNPTTTIGYTLGPGGTQLAPFAYKP